MTPSRERRLGAAGVWHYVTVDENGGGGSLPAGGSTGEVLTKESNADGDVGWEAGGGSQPGAVRLLDLGVVEAVDLLSGPVTLYTPDEGEIVGPVLLRDVVFVLDAGNVIIYGPELLPNPDDREPPLAFWDTDLSRDGYTAAAEWGVQTVTAAVTTTGVVKAGLTIGADILIADAWQANHAYVGSPIDEVVVGDGHLWYTDSTGDSGGTEPDWTANFGGEVVDGDITWTDNGAITDGSAHVYAYVATPVAP